MPVSGHQVSCFIVTFTSEFRLLSKLIYGGQLFNSAPWWYRLCHAPSYHTHFRRLLNIHRVSKTSNVWLAITMTHVDGFWYFWHKYYWYKVSNQKPLYYATSNNLCFCTTWQNGKTRKLHLFTQMPELNQSLLDFFKLLTHDSYSRCCMTP